VKIPRAKYKDFIGFKVGKVEVIDFEKVEEIRNRLVYFYKYKCECGTIESTTKGCLLISKRNEEKNKKTTYCCPNCRRNKLSEWAKKSCFRHSSPEDARCSVLHSNYRSKCKKKNWKFELTFDEFKKLVMSNCHYCNLEPNKFRKDISKKRQGMSRTYFNGIDRINSSEGYYSENVVPCCEDCNKAKRNLSYEQFLDLIKRIYEFKIK
jgi:hypothetical protein